MAYPCSGVMVMVVMIDWLELVMRVSDDGDDSDDVKWGCLLI